MAELNRCRGKTMRNNVMLLILPFLIIGCARYREPGDYTGHVYIKNYSLGELKTANIGESMVRVKDTFGNYTHYDHSLIASSDFKLTGHVDRFPIMRNHIVNIEGTKGIRYPLDGTKKIKGIEYNILLMKNLSHKEDSVGILVDKNGGICRDYILLNNRAISMPNALNIAPQDVTMSIGGSTMDLKGISTSMNHKELSGCYANFELIYSGINSVSFTMTYREFTSNDSARPSFSQKVEYETSAEQIRFKNIVIEVTEVSNEKIEFKVIRDGMEDEFYPKNATPQIYEDKYKYCESLM
jgi:hypothetical protein